MQTSERTLSIVEAILARKSVRVFRPDPVPPSVLRAVLDLARHAPSWSNTQPWEVAVMTGQPLASVKEAFAQKFKADVTPNPDIPWPRFPDRYHQRSRENGLSIFSVLGIRREDVDKKRSHNLGMQRFFEAPVGMVLYLESELGPWSILDAGIFIQTIMLAAVGHGLSTCPMAMVGRYPDVLRELLGIPATKRILCGLAMGYAEEDAPVNQFRSDRLPLDEFVLWCGDEA